MIRNMIYIPNKSLRDFSKNPFIARYLQKNEKETYDLYYNGSILTLTNDKNVYPFKDIDQGTSITIFIKEGQRPKVYYSIPPEEKVKEILWYFGQWTKSRITKNENVYESNKKSYEKVKDVKLLEIKEGSVRLLYKMRTTDIKRVKAYVPDDAKIKDAVAACEKLILLAPTIPVWKFEVMGFKSCWYNPTLNIIYPDVLSTEDLDRMKDKTLKKLNDNLSFI